MLWVYFFPRCGRNINGKLFEQNIKKQQKTEAPPEQKKQPANKPDRGRQSGGSSDKIILGDPTHPTI